MRFTSEYNPRKGRPHGAKNKKTLLMEERKALFEDEVEKMFISLIKKARPEYLLDQYIGKAKESVDVNANVKFSLLDIVRKAYESSRHRDNEEMAEESS